MLMRLPLQQPCQQLAEMSPCQLPDKLWVQGEMSATVVYYPNEYISLIPTLKARVAAGRSSLASNVNVGISTNFDKICGCVLQVLIAAAAAGSKAPPCHVAGSPLCSQQHTLRPPAACETAHGTSTAHHLSHSRPMLSSLCCTWLVASWWAPSD